VHQVSTHVQALRGAITVDANTADAILEATAELLTALRDDNGLDAAQVVSAIFTVTPDLDAVFPAAACRRLGWDDVSALCATEIPVPGALPRCVRVLVHVQRPTGAKARHVYLRDATVLRPDRAEP
jgi:chorismate mutase